MEIFTGITYIKKVYTIELDKNWKTYRGERVFENDTTCWDYFDDIYWSWDTPILTDEEQEKLNTAF
jgi:hypothetical protein